MQDLRELWQSRDLLFTWSERLIRARYRQSVLGILWVIAQPAAYVAILSVVFTRVVRIDTDGVPYVVFAYAAIVPWLLFSSSLNDMVTSVVDHMALVGKVYFRREVLPVAALLARLVDFAIAFVVLLAVAAAFGYSVSARSSLYLPLVLAVEIAAILGLGLAGAAANVFYRDAKHLFALAVQLWFYATPIIYPASAVPPALRPLYFVNPMAGVIEGFRAVLLHGSAPAPWLALSAFSALLLLVLGTRLFRRLEGRFADLI